MRNSAAFGHWFLHAFFECRHRDYLAASLTCISDWNWSGMVNTRTSLTFNHLVLYIILHICLCNSSVRTYHMHLLPRNIVFTEQTPHIWCGQKASLWGNHFRIGRYCLCWLRARCGCWFRAGDAVIWLLVFGRVCIDFKEQLPDLAYIFLFIVNLVNSSCIHSRNLCELFVRGDIS